MPVALEYTILESMQELKVLLDQKPERAGKGAEDSEARGEQEDKLEISVFIVHHRLEK